MSSCGIYFGIIIFSLFICVWSEVLSSYRYSDRARNLLSEFDDLSRAKISERS